MENIKIELLMITPNIEKHIELCGRCCYNSYERINDTSHEIFIKAIIKNNHLSVLEHGCASFKLSGISRACSQQLTRHRLASISQQSQRYVKENNFNYIIPSIFENKKEDKDLFINCVEEIQKKYNYLLDKGYRSEDCRALLPNACSTNLIITANMREWRHIIKERTSNAAQEEIRYVANNILNKLKEIAPNIFYDFE